MMRVWVVAALVAVMTILLWPRVVTGENLLRNHGFEEEADSGIFTEAQYWKMGSPDEYGDYWGSASRERWRGVGGEFVGAVRGIWANQGHYGGMWQQVAAVPGRTYRFSGWFFCDAEWVARTQEIKIEFWDQEYKTLLGSAAESIHECDIDWEQVSVEAPAPENTAWVRVVININNTGAMGSIQFDELSLIIMDN